MTRRRLILVLTIVLLGICAVPAINYLRWWKNYPVGPDANKADIRDCIRFAGSADFNRMSEADRYKYADAILQRMAKMPLLELLNMLTVEQYATHLISNFQRNWREIPNYKALEIHFMGTALDELYSMPPLTRKGVIFATVIAVDQRCRWDPQFAILPSQEEFMKQAFQLAGTNPRSQALGMKLLMDFDSQRRMLGLRDPFEVSAADIAAQKSLPK